MKKQNLLLLFGGQSSEHEISCMSAANVAGLIDKEKYEIIAVGITKSGRWLYVPDTASISDGSWEASAVKAVLSENAEDKALYLFEGDSFRTIRIDIALPVLHGLYGEDGTVQGLFELARIPYVGSGVLGSAVAMDKSMTKIVVETLGIRQAAYVLIMRNELVNMEQCVRRVEIRLSYPVFVKPACAGSSRGVSRAEDRESLEKALLLAAEHDGKILVEESIKGREIECSVFGADEVRASGVGEIIPDAEFYDFDAKYNNENSVTDVSPVLPQGMEDEIREAAVKIFKAVNAFGLSRVDFFLDEKGPVFNEINTLPGFTAISMYPMLWEKQGISKQQLVQDLLDTAVLRKEH